MPALGRVTACSGRSASVVGFAPPAVRRRPCTAPPGESERGMHKDRHGLACTGSATPVQHLAGAQEHPLLFRPEVVKALDAAIAEDAGCVMGMAGSHANGSTSGLRPGQAPRGTGCATADGVGSRCPQREDPAVAGGAADSQLRLADSRDLQDRNASQPDSRSAELAARRDPNLHRLRVARSRAVGRFRPRTLAASVG